MDGQNLLTLLQELGLRRLRVRSSWIDAECPFLERHSGGHDKNPSFSVKITTTHCSGFNCMACHMRGDLLALVWGVARHDHSPAAHERYSRLMAWAIAKDYPWGEISRLRLPEEEAEAGTSPQPKGTPVQFSSTGRRVPPFVHTIGAEPVERAESGKANNLLFAPVEPAALPETDLEAMRDMPPDVLEYLERRRLKPETIREWELGFHRGRVAIPIRDFKHRLVGISGRLVRDGARGPKYLHSLGFRRDYVLYGESKVVEGQTGYVVEGFFDVIGLWQSGYRNAVAIMGSYPSKHQVEKMTKFFTNIVIVPDGDNAGRDMALKVMEAVKPFLPVRMVEMPPGKDPADLSPSELADRLGHPDHAPV